MMLRLCLAVCLASVLVTAKPDYTRQNTILKFQSQIPFETQWTDFKAVNEKTYESDTEELVRKEIFRDNLKQIEMHNYLHSKGLKTYTLGINEYTDMEPKEFVKTMNGYRMNNRSRVLNRATYMSPLTKVQLPKEVDWRTEGYVTPVKNQGQCGSCWSFSATGSLEGQHFRKSGKMISLSEQNLVDCSVAWGNNGCNGGLMDDAFQYIKDNDGIDTEDSYPYQAVDGTCNYKAKFSGATDVGFTDIPKGDEDALKEALATVGPVSIAIDASQQSFQLYKSGVYVEPECSSEALDHGVLIVGYGTSEGQDYWIVKNSWGPTWGLEGYIWMARNKDNQCGVATSASYPVV
jgi:cathepsin L